MQMYSFCSQLAPGHAPGPEAYANVSLRHWSDCAVDFAQLRPQSISSEIPNLYNRYPALPLELLQAVL